MTIVVAPFRGPLTGRKVASQCLVDDLRASLPGRTVIIDTAGPGATVLLNWMVKAFAYLRAAVCILVLRPRLRWVYVAGEAGRSTWLSSALVCLASSAGIPNHLHHHSSSYIDRWHPAIDATSRCDETRHIVNCDALGEGLQLQYGIQDDRWRTIHNAAWLSETNPRRMHPVPADGALHLGLMSNLTREKGIDEALATLEQLLDMGVPAHLLLAGPADAHARQSISHAQRRLGQHLEYLGPLYGREKATFFHHLDVFVFPGRYAHETQGIVNLEAMSHGIPVLTTRRWCMAEDVIAGAGWLVEPTVPFAPSAAAILAQLDADSLTRASSLAYARSVHLGQLGRQQVNTLIETVRR